MSELRISEVIVAVAGLLLAELGPGRVAKEARSPAPDPEAEHEIDRDQKI